MKTALSSCQVIGCTCNEELNDVHRRRVRDEIEIVPSDVSWLLWMKLIISIKDRMVFGWYLTNIDVVCSCFDKRYALKASETMPIGIMGSISSTLHIEVHSISAEREAWIHLFVLFSSITM